MARLAQDFGARAALALAVVACGKSSAGGGPRDASVAPDGASMDSAAGLDGGARDASPGVTLTVALHRADGGSPNPIEVVVHASGGSTGLPIDGLSIAVDYASTTVTARGQGGGAYTATVQPPFPSGELPITARLSSEDAGVSRTALVLPLVSPSWDQPEAVPGLVNTPGTEDSSSVSPDGQWLIVATYSPVDLLCCSIGCGGFDALDGKNPACSDVLGPISGPARPGLPGGERVVSSTQINFADPTMCAEEPDGGPLLFPSGDGGVYPFALPPVAIYGFQRQADGSYAQPFLIDTGSDGFVGQPFCLTFLGTGTAGTKVGVIFAYNLDEADSGPPRSWFGEVTLGETTSFGSYACHSATLPAYPTFTPNGIAPLPIAPATQQAGNTTIAPGPDGGYYLFSDDELASPKYVEYSWTADGGAYTNWAPMAVPNPSQDESQPAALGSRLYMHYGNDVWSVAWNGGSPGDAGSFSDLHAELTAEPNPGDGGVIAVGQPSFAAIDGGATMFFVYYLHEGAGTNGEIGYVPPR